MEWTVLILIIVLVVIYYMNNIASEHFRGGGGGGGGRGGGGMGGGIGSRGGFGGYGGAGLNAGSYGDFEGGIGGRNSITDRSIGVGPYGFNRQVGYPSTNAYADRVAYDLQNPFNTYDSDDADGYEDAPWDPYTYREVMEPNGQIVGNIVAN